jgi:predicted nucleotidyltransferase
VNLTVTERTALAELTSWVRERFGSRVGVITLFGSRARGEGDEDSDVDVLVVIDDLTGEEGRSIAHHCGDLLTKHDVLISPFTLSRARFDLLRARERLIVSEIERDGIPL